MNKQEITIVVLLFMLLLGWGYLQRANMPPQTEPSPQPGFSVVTNNTPEQTTAKSDQPEPPLEPPLAASTSSVSEIKMPQVKDDGHTEPEQIVVLSNDLMNVSVSSWGGAIVSVELNKYRTSLDKTSGPLRLDFSQRPALSLTGVPGLSTNNDCKLELQGSGKSVQILRHTGDGVTFVRAITITDNYSVNCSDSFSNATAAAIALPARQIAIGPMNEMAVLSGGYAYLGVDTLAAHGGESVKYWAADFPSFFGQKSRGFSCARQDMQLVPPEASHKIEGQLAWASVKDKFFVQILSPASGSAECELRVQRNMTVSNSLVVASVSAGLILPEKLMQPGESLGGEVTYYVGPKEYSSLKKLGDHRDEVMEFGKWFGWLCPPLLWTLNMLYRLIPNYGVAIILLTGMIKFILWPITRKSTQSMKEMQKLQPLISELRIKYKDKPQKLNQETMALYKEHKVNPMAGCLPILVQIPVFFALFTVLRSGVELRFAEFLWIKDLSEPEGLLAETAFFKMLPFVGALNILPLLMTATTLWQQQLMPTAGDAQQQKMMKWMPVVFLAMFYNMASALVLYWTTNQALSIVGLMWQKRKPAPAPAK